MKKEKKRTDEDFDEKSLDYDMQIEDRHKEKLYRWRQKILGN